MQKNKDFCNPLINRKPITPTLHSRYCDCVLFNHLLKLLLNTPQHFVHV